MLRRLVLVLVASVLIAGCGDDEPTPTAASAPATTETVGRVSGPASNGEELEADDDRSAEGVDGLSVCDLMPVARVERLAGVPRGTLRARPNDSLDLSVCDYGGRGVQVAILLDGAADATRRYFNQLYEAYQKFNRIPSLRAHNVKGIGDDGTYGGTGAWWTIGRKQLVAFDADRIARVAVSVPGSTNAQRKAAASALAKALFAQLPEERQG